MKKNMLAAMLLLPGLFFAQSHENPTKVALNENGIGHQFPECMRSGPVCDLFPKDSNPKDSKVSAYKTSNTSVVIEISNEFLSEEKQLAVLGRLIRDIPKSERVTVPMEIDFPISAELLRALNMDVSLNTIKAGSYPVEIADTHLLLRFELSSK
jgi:hypothetical protein